MENYRGTFLPIRSRNDPIWLTNDLSIYHQSIKKNVGRCLQYAVKQHLSTTADQYSVWISPGPLGFMPLYILEQMLTKQLNSRAEEKMQALDNVASSLPGKVKWESYPAEWKMNMVDGC